MLHSRHNRGEMLLLLVSLLILILSPGFGADNVPEESNRLEATTNMVSDESANGLLRTKVDSESSDDLARLLDSTDADELKSKPPKWCKYNLKDYTRYAWHWNNQYEVFRDPHYEHLWIGDGPKQYYKYNLPKKFHHVCGAPPSKPKILSFYLRLPKNTKRYVQGCIGHHDTHHVEIPHITAYNCNGTAIRCLWKGFKFNKPQELLIVWSPESHHSPDAYWIQFTKHPAHHEFCDSYPFYEEIR